MMKVFWGIGTGGMTYCVDVITADISTLRNRGLAYAFTSSPYMITAFAGAKASEQFYENIGWRWAFGVFAIVFPIVAAPLFFILKMNLRKAQKQVFDGTSRSGRSLLESIWHWTLEFDRETFSPNRQRSANFAQCSESFYSQSA